MRLPRAASPFPETVLCSSTGSRGAGATTVAGPILMSPARRIEACTTGGGAITDVAETLITRFEETTPGSGAGATPEACGKPSWRDIAWLTSGEGATATVGTLGMFNREVPVEASGITGVTTFEARILGRAGPFSLMSGGVMAAWARSGATRIEPRCADSAGFLNV